MNQKALKEVFQKAMDAIKANPKNASMPFNTKTELVEGVKCSAQVRDFPPMTVDEPPEMGGTNAGVNPGELLLIALGTCQEIMYSACAALMDIPLNKVTVNLKGDLDLRGLLGMDNSVPAGFSSIYYETTIDSDAGEGALKQLVEVTESHCPMLDMLRRPVDVRGTVSIRKGGKITKIS